jgi:hypothetical protein
MWESEGMYSDYHTRIDEIKSLGHCHKDLLIDALWHAIFAHEFNDVQFVLSVNERLSFDEHGQQGRSRLQLLPEGEHLLVAQDGQAEVEWSRNARNEIERSEFSGQLLHGENHLQLRPK